MEKEDLHPTSRFSDRVEAYVRYRPSYPAQVIPFLSREIGLSPDKTVADIGSGTGIFSKLFLENGNRVFGVEPNGEMRKAGEKFLSSFKGFVSVDGTAEATTLPDSSADVITAAQAFHWFDPEKCRVEFKRIGKPGSRTVLIWNERKTGTSAFSNDYERLLLETCPDYLKVNHASAANAGKIDAFFAPGNACEASFPNVQLLDRDGFQGRVFSSSYSPKPSDVSYGEFLRRLDSLFERHVRNGHVAFEYDTRVYYGRI